MITVDTRAIALKVAVQMRAHQKSLAGKASDADRAHGALRRTAEAITTHGNEHADWAYTASEEWTGRSADGFDRRAGRVGKSLEVTADAAAQGATIVSSTHGALDAGHRAVTQLIDEYVGRASQVLDAGLKVTGAGSRAAIMTAVATVVELVGSYTKESAKHLGAVQTQMTDAAKRLAELERAVDHDGIADARRKPRRPDKGNDAPKTRSGVQNKIKKVAAGELGYAEGAGNRNKYGPQAAWCSSFATWVWRKSGVDIPILPFTGDVYHWGERHDLAYDKRHLDQVRPGDVLLFGTGPENTNTSKHIGIVESVHGDRVTLIEGNSSDRVQRVTHTLSPATFYGGVHPR